MGLSRRQFTKEFKLAAIQRLEMGARLAEVARAFEVNPSLLHRWQREFLAKGRAMCFRAPGNGAGRRARSRNWSARLANRRWRLIF
jgi:transposase-like protein